MPIYAVFLTSSQLASANEMRRILLSTIKILISGALLYFSLRKTDLSGLASRINVESLG
jgi:glycosyltransferase 2 family protein